ncbi:hypothetical protein TB1_007808 [Malus domestica]
MGSERSHSTQNDTPIGPSMKQRKQEGNRVTLQNNKIVMRNEVLQEQYEKNFEMLHEARHAQAHKLVAPAEVNNHLNAPQHGGSPISNTDIPDRDRATHQCDNQHETSLNPAAST